jgi:hypothetical protein
MGWDGEQRTYDATTEQLIKVSLVYKTPYLPVSRRGFLAQHVRAV